jgi:hypothetical protein
MMRSRRLNTNKESFGNLKINRKPIRNNEDVSSHGEDSMTKRAEDTKPVTLL